MCDHCKWLTEDNKRCAQTNPLQSTAQQSKEMDSYSVNVNNRFALFLDDEDDPGDAIIPTPAKKEESVKSSKSAKQAGKGKENKDKAAQQAKKKAVENGTKTAGGESKPQSNSKAPGRPNSSGQGRGENRRERGDRDDRPPRGPRAGRPRLSSKEKEGEGGFGGDSADRRDGRGNRERGARPFRGGRGGGFGGPRKREFERRSGNDKSSVKPFEKREGGGAHNWGRQEDLHNDEWNNEEEPTPDTEQPVVNGETTTEEPKTDEKTENEEEATPVDEEPKEMTLEEYRAKNQTGRVVSELQERKAGENVDSTQWKDTFQLEKADEEFFSGTREVIEKPKTSGRIKTTIDTTGFFFKDQARRGRGRGPGGPVGRSPGGPPGNNRAPRQRNDEDRRQDDRKGRGEDRRGRGTGRPSGGRRRDYAPNVEDEKDFPSLGAQ